MLVKPLVFDGHCGIDQRLGNFIQGGHLTVRGGVDLLQLLNITAVIHVIYKGCLVHAVIIDGPVGGLQQNVILQIVTQGAHKDTTADQHDQNHSSCGTHRNFQQRKSDGNNHVTQLQDPVRIPLLPGLARSPSAYIFIFHNDITSKHRGTMPVRQL